jgi:hypothetical protein
MPFHSEILKYRVPSNVILLTMSLPYNAVVNEWLKVLIT